MTHRLLCLLMHGRTNQPTANPCVSLPAPQFLLLSQMISFPISPASQHILGHCLGTYLLNSTDLATTLSETSCPRVLLVLPSTGTGVQLCPAVLQQPTGEARQPEIIPFVIPSFTVWLHTIPHFKSQVSCSPEKPCLLGVSSSAASQLENYVWEPHIHSQNLLEFKQALFLINPILNHDSRVVTVKKTPLFLHLERNSWFLSAEPARQG